MEEINKNINENNILISAYIKELQEYYFKIGSTKDTKYLIDRA